MPEPIALIITYSAWTLPLCYFNTQKPIFQFSIDVVSLINVRQYNNTFKIPVVYFHLMVNYTWRLMRVSPGAANSNLFTIRCNGNILFLNARDLYLYDYIVIKLIYICQRFPVTVSKDVKGMLGIKEAVKHPLHFPVEIINFVKDVFSGHLYYLSSLNYKTLQPPIHSQVKCVSL